MNTLVHLTFIFIFILVLIWFNLASLRLDQRLKWKIYVFSGVALFECIIQLITKLSRKEYLDFKYIIKKGLKTGILSIVGYTIYVDTYLDNTSWKDKNSLFKQNLMATIFATGFVGFGSLTEYLLHSGDSR